METPVNRTGGPAAWLSAVLAAAMLAGCDANTRWHLGLRPSAPRGRVAVPEPIHLLLPRKLEFRAFTGTRTFDKEGGIRGVEVCMQAKDAFDDPTKAFGDFRFELYTHRPNAPDPKGTRLAAWEVPLADSRKNRLYWSGTHSWYQFKLKWTRAIPIGRRFVLTATFTSPFTERLFAEQQFVSGQ